MNAQIEQWNGIGSSKAVSCSYKKLIYYKGPPQIDVEMLQWLLVGFGNPVEYIEKKLS